ncbi:protein-tyrosine phosphatase-like protein [Lipomyces japonicus]|uniref:protein-tyrosine phosphatase-like protein n=1 Tax=Lipomyces japonicus TaxID=56871 RepID=UPI0034CDBB54
MAYSAERPQLVAAPPSFFDYIPRSQPQHRVSSPSMTPSEFALAPASSFSSTASADSIDSTQSSVSNAPSTASSSSCFSSSTGPPALAKIPAFYGKPLSASSSTSSSATSLCAKSAAATAAAAVSTDVIAPLCTQELASVIASEPASVLVLDVRPCAQFTAERVVNSVNLCIPSTLLKRPAFTVPKILDSLSSTSSTKPADACSNWAAAKMIVVYDASSSSLVPSSPVFLTAFKFYNDPSFTGTVYYLKGGFAEFKTRFAKFVTQDDAMLPSPPTPSSSKKACDSLCLPILSGLHLPIFSKNKQASATPFFSNIRQNMDLIGGVGEPIPIRVPAGCTVAQLRRLPLWIQEVLPGCDGAKKIADRFFEIEKDEQKRLQSAFSTSCAITTAKECIASAFRSESSQAKTTPQFTISAALERGTKNRYNNIFPYDHTRVKLKSGGPGACDYINASFVSAQGSRKRYIATQGPLPDTFADFWSVVWDQNVRVIVMLTPTQEGGQVKCHSYWKDTKYGNLNLVLVSEQEMPLSSKTGTLIRVRKFSLSDSSRPFEPVREVTHLQYVSWPDLGAPADPIDIVSLTRLTSQYNDEGSGSSTTDGDNVNHPVIVHCSAGCGRTGTFCTVDSVIDMLEFKPEYNSTAKNVVGDLVAQVVHDFRTQRLSMVQSLRQFVICYESVLVWKLDELQTQE